MPERSDQTGHPRAVPDDFLTGSAAEHAAPYVRALEDAMAPVMHERIGAWRLRRELGRGGMGTVYLAERADEHYEQHVALKVVRGSLALNDHLISQFREERQIVATLDHPHIARLLDGGVTREGLPWYAMEYVDGLPVNTFVTNAKFSVAETLTLFLAICEAVQYAHRKFIVHRDLKPSNLLVSSTGHVKLVDFGIARLMASDIAHAPQAIAPQPGDETQGTWVTPAYASPEQLRGEPIAVTDDVYSLGVVLNELLTGFRPRPAPEMQRDTRSVVPRASRGDLDAIITKALASSSANRYQSVEALGDDIASHLRGDRISARRTESGYGLRYFIRRRVKSVLAVAVVFLSLVGGTSFALLQAQRADRERDASRVAAAKAGEISEFLTRLLMLSDPNAVVGEPVTVAAAIDSAAAWLGRDLASAPEAHAELALVLARLYGAMGQPRRHRLMADSALAMQERLWGPDDPRLSLAIAAVAESMWDSDDLATFEPTLRRMRALALRDTVLGAMTAVHAENLLAISLRNQGRLGEAEGVLRGILARRSVLDTAYPVGLDQALTGLGHVLLAAGHAKDASEAYREVLARRREQYGAAHPEVANALINLGSAMGRLGDYAEAEQLYVAGLAMRRETQGDTHAEIGVDLAGLGAVYVMAGNVPAAIRAYREAVGRLRRSHGADHAMTREAGTILAELEAKGHARN